MKSSLDLTEKDLENLDILGEKLIQLAEIIIRKHFYASYADKDDLVSVGVLKALTLIHEDKWTKAKGNFMTYIYTGMRNEIHNYLYHQNKFSTVDPDSLRDEGIDDKYFVEEVCYIEYSLIHSVCINFINSFGEGIEELVLDKIKDIGYIVRGKVEGEQTNSLKCYNSIIREQYDESTEEDVIGRLIGLILWKKKERER